MNNKAMCSILYTTIQAISMGFDKEGKYLHLLLYTSLFLSVVKSEERIFDLTWDFDENKTIYWPKVQPFMYTKEIADSRRGYWYSAKEFCTGEHGGTHIDAPYHFHEIGWKVSEIPTERLFVKGACVDLSNETNILGPNATLTVDHLEEWEKIHGSFENGTVLLVKFGWSKFWNNTADYLGFDKNRNINFPGISKEAAYWIVKKKKFYGVGIDTASIDPGNSQDFSVHRTLLEHKLYCLENVKLTENLPAHGFDLIIAPMKMKQGSGGPVRIFAVHCDIKND